MNTQPTTTVFGLSTLESELRAMATTLLADTSGTVVYPVIAPWHEGPLSVYIAPTDTGTVHAPTHVLALTRLEHNNISYTVFLGGR